VNTAYKHLDTKLRIAELTIGQWLSILLGIGVAVAWGKYLSPLGTYPTVVTAIYLGAVPAGAALLASASEIDVWLLIRSALRWRRLDGRFISGPGTARGYVVREDAEQHARGRSRPPVRELDLASLWGER
jgi:hypothetical protein